MIGISPDPPELLRWFRAEHKLPFTLLSDPEHRIINLYGCWKAGGAGDQVTGNVTRGHYVLDEKGRILDIQIGITPEESVERAVRTLLLDAGRLQPAERGAEETARG